jgi:hypothetical protein
VDAKGRHVDVNLSALPVVSGRLLLGEGGNAERVSFPPQFVVFKAAPWDASWIATFKQSSPSTRFR